MAFLLPLLDGSHEALELVNLHPPEEVTQVTVARVLSLMHAKGLLVEGEEHATAERRAANVTSPNGDPLGGRQLLFWGRQLDITRSVRHADEIQRALQAAQIVIVATGLFGIAACDLLMRSGCNSLRIVPNSGGLSSVEVYPVVMNITEIEPGIYHFDSVEHDLALLRAGQFRPWLEEIVLFQAELAAAAAALVLTSAVGRLQSKYGPRGYRLGLLDVGHVAQNCYLAATALGLRACATAGFIDAELDGALGVDGVEVSTMLVILLGPSR